jgi:hypothetical protein
MYNPRIYGYGEWHGATRISRAHFRSKLPCTHTYCSGTALSYRVINMLNDASDDDDDDDLLLSDRLGISTRARERKRRATAAPTTAAAAETNDDDDSDDDYGDVKYSLSSVGGTTSKQGQKTDRDVQSVMEAMSAERERRCRMLQLRQLERENLSRDKVHKEQAAANRRESDVFRQQNGRPTLQDSVSGLTVLYKDYSLFDNKDVVKKRVRAIDDCGYASFGGRPGLIQFVAVNDSEDESGAEGFSCCAFGSYEDAIRSLSAVFRNDHPEVAAKLEESAPIMAAATRRIAHLLKSQIDAESSRGQSSRAFVQSVVSWLHRAAMTGTGKQSLCPQLERLSSMALDVLMRLEDPSVKELGPSIDAFHAVMNQYRSAQHPAAPSPSIASSGTYMNQLGLEHALTYWSCDRIVCSAAGEGAVPTALATLSTLSLVLIDESLGRLHVLARESMQGLLFRLSTQHPTEPDHGGSMLAQIAEQLFRVLPSTVGAPPRNVKYVDDEQASLATSHLLGGLLQLSDRTTNTTEGFDAASATKCLKRFQLECARVALSCLDVSTEPKDENPTVPGFAGPPPATASTTIAPGSAIPNPSAGPTSSGDGDSHGVWMDRPEGVDEESWEALRVVVHVLEHFPKNKERDARCLAVFDATFHLFRAAMQWLERSISSSNATDALPGDSVVCHQASSAPPPLPSPVAEFGTERQAKAVLQVLDRLSHGLANVGRFLGSYTRNEYFRHADLQLQVVNAYVEQMARPRCANQAGVRFKPIELKQQDIRKYFGGRSPESGDNNADTRP